MTGSSPVCASTSSRKAGSVSTGIGSSFAWRQPLPTTTPRLGRRCEEALGQRSAGPVEEVHFTPHRSLAA